MSDMPIGQLVKLYRIDGRKTTAYVATHAGITARYYEMIEAGAKTPSIPVLSRIAKALGVRTAALLGEVPREENGSAGPRLAEVEKALYSYRSLTTTEATCPTLEELDDSVRAAWDAWLTSPNKYSDVLNVLPQLIVDCERAVHEYNRSREACRIASELYQLARPVLKHLGRVDLGRLVADRIMRFSEETEDPLLIGCAAWNLGLAMLPDDMSEGAYEVAIKAGEALEPSLPDGGEAAFSAYGALMQLASVASVRGGDPWKARELLRGPARQAAERVGDGKNYHHQFFGPTNLTIHTEAVELESGEISDCLRISDDVDVARVNSLERKTAHLYQLAHAYACRGDDTAVFVHLKMAHQLCPEDFRHRRVIRDMVATLVRRAKPSYASEVRGLAHQIGLLN